MSGAGAALRCGRPAACDAPRWRLRSPAACSSIDATTTTVASPGARSREDAAGGRVSDLRSGRVGLQLIKVTGSSFAVVPARRVHDAARAPRPAAVHPSRHRVALRRSGHGRRRRSRPYVASEQVATWRRRSSTRSSASRSSTSSTRSATRMLERDPATRGGLVRGTEPALGPGRGDRHEPSARSTPTRARHTDASG